MRRLLVACLTVVAAIGIAATPIDAHHGYMRVWSFGEFQDLSGYDIHPPDRVDIYYAGWRPFTYIWADCANKGGVSWTQSWFPGYSLFFCMGVDY